MPSGKDSNKGGPHRIIKFFWTQHSTTLCFYSNGKALVINEINNIRSLHLCVLRISTKYDYVDSIQFAHVRPYIFLENSIRDNALMMSRRAKDKYYVGICGYTANGPFEKWSVLLAKFAYNKVKAFFPSGRVFNLGQEMSVKDYRGKTHW